jgi:hypothetical protein
MSSIWLSLAAVVVRAATETALVVAVLAVIVRRYLVNRLVAGLPLKPNCRLSLALLTL